MEIRVENFKKSLSSFEYLLMVDKESLKMILNEQLIDGIENGIVQKFEIVTEQCWKMLKKYLLIHAGVDTKTPKAAIKAFFLAGHLSENDYELLMGALDDRNALSHIYDEDEFLKIFNRFKSYLQMFKNVLSVMESK